MAALGAPLDVIDTAIDGVKVFVPRRFGDDRGYFCESHNRRALAALGFDIEFVQDNHAFSKLPFTMRGIHYQTGAHVQDKLVRVITGSAVDVAVDLRKGSPTFGKYASAMLTAERGETILVPKGFGHGIMTLEPGTHIVYKSSAYYSPEHEHGIIFDDPALGIDWGVRREFVQLSPRDETLPVLSEQQNLL